MTETFEPTGRGTGTVTEVSPAEGSVGTKYCIMSHNRSLPVNLDSFGRMIRKNHALSTEGRRATDVDWLLALSEGLYDTIWWTAPEDLEPGSIMFVHLRGLPGEAVSPALLEAAEGREDRGTLVPNLQHAEKLARLYGDTIFVVARVGSIAEEFVGNQGEREHSVILNRAHVFTEPLPVAEISDVVQIQEGLFTRLGRNQFVTVRERLARRNALPDFLAGA